QIDVDLDDEVAAEVAKHFLPETDLVFGRPGREATHRVYRTSSPVKYLKLSNPKGGRPLLEIRTARYQTIAPGSYHPKDGLRVDWNLRGNPASVRPADVTRDCYKTAAVALLVHAWPERGQRHDAALCLAGGLKSQGWSEGEAEEIVEVVAKVARDEEADNRVQ